jgi:SAM-dependent methyltransferase
MSDDRLVSAAASRNRDAILAVLRGALPERGLVLEVASGSGQHAAHFAAALPGLTFQPTDRDPAARASIDAWAREAGLPNLRPAAALDCTAGPWPVDWADAVLCFNMIHIAPWAAAEGLIAGAARVLRPGGVLVLYGPFRRAGHVLAPSNAAFDASLTARDPAWGLRSLERVAALAEAAGFAGPEVEPMPANNLTILFRRMERDD